MNEVEAVARAMASTIYPNPKNVDRNWHLWSEQAQAAIAAIAAFYPKEQEEISILRAENERLQKALAKATTPHWFWLWDNVACRAFAIETVLNMACGYMGPSRIIARIGRSASLSDVWVFARGDPDRQWIITEHETEEAARAASAALDQEETK